jgi:hypothetical protein
VHVFHGTRVGRGMSSPLMVGSLVCVGWQLLLRPHPPLTGHGRVCRADSASSPAPIARQRVATSLVNLPIRAESQQPTHADVVRPYCMKSSRLR